MSSLPVRACPALGIVTLMSIAVSGCFSGSSSSSGSAPAPAPAPEWRTGVFVDSPVAGLVFSTGSTEGVTDQQGTFRYQAGETVSFSLGGLALGSAPGEPVLTPLSLIEGAQDSSHPAVVNLSRLLQSLDADGNLANGIQLTEELRASLDGFLASNAGFELALEDPATFEAAAAELLDHLNGEDLFEDGSRELRTRLQAWLHLQDSLDRVDGRDIDFSKRPVIFVHGGAGSASQFESQAQRFIANGYPRSHLATYEYNTSPPDFARTTAELDAAIDDLLRSTGFDQVHLMGHSMGTEVSRLYLANPTRAAKVAAYVNLDGRADDAPPGGIPNLVLWGQYVTQTVVGAENVYPDADDPVGHIEVATSADSFARMYRFFNNGAEPATTRIPRAEGEHLWIAGRANLFPANTGATGTVLEITEVDPLTGSRLSDSPKHEQPITADGHWGPLRINNGATYEFVLRRPSVANADHYFYREPYHQDSYQVRLNTSLPGGGVGALLTRGPNHSNLSISRDMELWGDQEERNDKLLVNGTNVVTAQTGPLLNRLSNIFLTDRGADGVSNLAVADPTLHAIPFMSGLDLHIPGRAQPDRAISVELASRRGEEPRLVNVPNWSSDRVRSISIHFRDHDD